LGIGFSKAVLSIFSFVLSKCYTLLLICATPLNNGRKRSCLSGLRLEWCCPARYPAGVEADILGKSYPDLNFRLFAMRTHTDTYNVSLPW
jgi:hypothetical protein